MSCLLSITVYRALIELTISATTNITPTTISATNRPVLDEIDETSEIEVMDASIG